MKPHQLLVVATLAVCGPARADDWVPPPNEPVAGPVASFMRSNAGWQATVSLHEPAVAIAWRLGEKGPWNDTGLLDAVDPRTGRRMANSSFPLDANTPAGTVYIRYANATGTVMGPFAVAFDPMSELVRSQRQILEMMPGSWVSFRDFNGVLLYFTTLVSYRCAIQELRIGIDAPKPGKLIKLSPCDPADPNAIPGNYQPYMQVPRETRSASVQIVFRDGSASKLTVIQR